MSGMVTTGDTNSSSYNSRTVEFEVTGLCRQAVMRTSNYKVKVPYSRMSQTMQSINRMGGKVAKVTLLPATAPAPEAAPAAESEERPSARRRGRNKG